MTSMGYDSNEIKEIIRMIRLESMCGSDLPIDIIGNKVIIEYGTLKIYYRDKLVAMGPIRILLNETEEAFGYHIKVYDIGNNEYSIYMYEYHFNGGPLDEYIETSIYCYKTRLGKEHTDKIEIIKNIIESKKLLLCNYHGGECEYTNRFVKVASGEEF